MNGIIEISDGVLSISNGQITNVSNIDTDTLNTNSLTLETQIINGDLEIIGDNADSYDDPTAALRIIGGVTVSQNLYSDTIFTHNLHAVNNDIDLSGNVTCDKMNVLDQLNSNITNISNNLAISGESVTISSRVVMGDDLIVNKEIITQSINILNPNILPNVGNQSGYVEIKLNGLSYYVPIFLGFQ